MTPETRAALVALTKWWRDCAGAWPSNSDVALAFTRCADQLTDALAQPVAGDRAEVYPNSDRGLLAMTDRWADMSRDARLGTLRGIQEAAFRAGREDMALRSVQPSAPAAVLPAKGAAIYDRLYEAWNALTFDTRTIPPATKDAAITGCREELDAVLKGFEGKSFRQWCDEQIGDGLPPAVLPEPDDAHKPVREMLERVVGLPVSADCTFAFMDGAGDVDLEEMLKEAFDGFHGRKPLR